MKKTDYYENCSLTEDELIYITNQIKHGSGTEGIGYLEYSKENTDNIIEINHSLITYITPIANVINEKGEWDEDGNFNIPVYLEVVGCILEDKFSNIIKLPPNQMKIITEALDNVFYMNEKYTS
jgi:hypothetical protein